MEGVPDTVMDGVGDVLLDGDIDIVGVIVGVIDGVIDIVGVIDGVGEPVGVKLGSGVDDGLGDIATNGKTDEFSAVSVSGIGKKGYAIAVYLSSSLLFTSVS